MSPEWKPGDVALVLNEHGFWNVAIRVVGRPDFWQYGVSQTASPTNADARPLVVVDPEGVEQVERLTRLIFGPLTSASGTSVQEALREFANPKPDEPTGLGAVVEDAEGNRWVRDEAGGSEPRVWYRRGEESSRNYADVTAVRVLSEGVTS